MYVFHLALVISAPFSTTYSDFSSTEKVYVNLKNVRNYIIMKGFFYVIFKMIFFLLVYKNF